MSEVAEAGMEKLAGLCHSQFPAGTGHMNPIIQQLMQPGMTTAQVTRVTLNDLHDQGSAMDHVPHTLSSCSPPAPTCPGLFLFPTQMMQGLAAQLLERSLAVTSMVKVGGCRLNLTLQIILTFIWAHGTDGLSTQHCINLHWPLDGPGRDQGPILRHR